MPNVVVALAVLILGYAAGAFFGRLANRGFEKIFHSTAVASLFSSIIKMLVIAIGFFVSKSGERRIDIDVEVSYGEDLQHVSETLRRAIEGLDFLRPHRSVDVFALEFGSSSINFSVRYWIDYPNGQVDYFEAIDRGLRP